MMKPTNIRRPPVTANNAASMAGDISCYLNSRFLDFARNDSPKMSVVAYVHWRAHLYIVIKQFCAIRRLTDTAMRSGVAGQNSHVHTDAFFGQTQEPSHRRAGEVRAARSRIYAGADSGAHQAARRVHKIAVQI